MRTCCTCLFIFFSYICISQGNYKSNLIYADKQGIICYTKDQKEAAFFGVNYTVPFAYGYRSIKALGIDPEKAIDADVYHMSRLGLDAFRVHMWDVELTDSLGNLLNNEHLRLFDYLLQRLKERHIKILITPIAFWGNGYPEPDIITNGFSYVYGKGNAVVKEEAIRAQENYLKQLMAHVNPYTKLTYKDDPDVIALEINNEPHHSGPKEKTTEYINRLAASVRSAGWTKPVFYNISESPSYADAVAKANVDGHSFQWYPTGLVANHEQKGNFLPDVDTYYIPFIDTIPAFRNKARMVYEFDAGDVLQPIMYPAMARSFRTAGFQWATQFAYDPMATAYANTEYQTHYLNLAYTPAKAISLLIASKVFHQLPRLKSYGQYPADTVFDVFRVSYEQQLSEMNSNTEFYYSNNTTTVPKNVHQLQHIAGVGSSPVVHYEGTGAYFLDKISINTWRLEVMPDAITVTDPFEKASPKKEVTAIHWQKQIMKLMLLGWTHFFIQGANHSNTTIMEVTDGSFALMPGVYMLSKEAIKAGDRVEGEFYAPASTVHSVLLVHHPLTATTAGIPFSIDATIAGVTDIDKATMELRNTANKWKTVSLQKIAGNQYHALLPAEMLTQGLLNYRIMVVQRNGDTYTFPGGNKGNPYAWDAYQNDSWQTAVVPASSPIVLFNPNTDRDRINLYNTDWRNNAIIYTITDKPDQLIQSMIMNKPVEGERLGWQYYFGDKIEGRRDELKDIRTLVIRARATQPQSIKLSLIISEADAYAAHITLSSEWKEYEVPLSSLKKDAFLLLPRPYPGFLPLQFATSSKTSADFSKAERIELSFAAGAEGAPVSIEVERIWLKKQ